MSASLLSGPGTGIAMLNETGTLIVANRDFYDLTGYDAEDAPELSLTDIWPDAQKVLSSVSGVRGEWRGEAHISRGDGSAVPLSLSATSAMRAHGVPDGFVIKIGALSDETGPVWVDQTTGDDSIGRLEHQLRGLHTTISVNLELIDRYLVDGSFRSRVALMRTAVESGFTTLESIRRRTRT